MAAKKIGNSIFRTEREAGVDSALGDWRKADSEIDELKKALLTPYLANVLSNIKMPYYFPAGRIRKKFPMPTLTEI